MTALAAPIVHQLNLPVGGINENPHRPPVCRLHREWQCSGKENVHCARMVLAVPVHNLGHLNADISGSSGKQDDVQYFSHI
jgi:hypothetical protein